MQKALVRTAIGLGVLIALFAIARLTGMLQMYKTYSSANEPTIGINDLVWTSNLKSRSQFDFIVFYSDQQPFSEGKKSAFIFRLVGMPGQVIELREGVLFINGKNADADLQLPRSYKVSAKFAASLSPDELLDFEGQDSIIMPLTSEQAGKAGLKPFIDTAFNSAIQSRWNHSWSTDNFGPVTVPPGHCFVLGDNRWNASDSRYIGFIPMKDVKGTVLNKH